MALVPPEWKHLRGGIANARRHCFCYMICLNFYYPLPLC